MALTKIGATLGGSADVITVTQSSHGLLVGRPVKMTSSGYAHATADSAANAEAVGIVIVSDWDGSSGANTTFSLALGGRITTDGCVPNLATGTVLFLQVASGLLAATEPDGNNQVSKPMAVITIANSEMIMVQQRGEVISTAGITLVDGSVDNDAMADNAINTAEIVNDAVTADKLANSINTEIAANKAKVTNATHTGDVTGATALTIATDAVDIAMLSASGTADGTTFLRGDNQWAAAGGGNLIKIGTAVASSSSTLDITGLDSTYDTYMLVGSDLRPSNQGVELSMRLGDSSGFDSGASDYSWYAIRNAAGSSSYVGVNDAEDSRIAIAIGGTGADANEGAGFVGWLHSPGDGTSLSIISGNHSNIDTGNNLQVGTFGGMRRNTVITVDRVQILFSAGTITSGRFTVLGVKHD